MFPARSHATSVGRLKVDPGTPDPAGPRPPPRPPRPSAPPAAAGAPPAPGAPLGAAPRAPSGPPPRPPSGAAPRPPPGAPARTAIVSGLRPSTSATLPSASNFTTWLAAESIGQTLAQIGRAAGRG